MEPLQLEKGQGLDLTKDGTPGGEPITRFSVGMGWELKPGNEFDLDVSIIPSKGGVVDSSNIVYFGKLATYANAIKHGGDNLVGGTGGDESDQRSDDEQIYVDMNNIPADVDALSVVVNIYKANGKTFGDLDKAYIRLCDFDGNNVGDENFFHDLDENIPSNNAAIIANFTRSEGGWRMSIVDQGLDGDLNALAAAVPATLPAQTA